MKRLLSCGFAAALVTAASVGAQSMNPISKPITFGIAGGASIPTGDLSDFAKTGYNVSALLEFRGAMWPVALRLEGQWQQMDFKQGLVTPGGGTVGAGSVKTLGALSNVVYYFPNQSLVKPYVTGGIGVINYKEDVGSGSPSTTKFAYDLGAGLDFRLTGFATFVEADWQSIELTGGSARTFPIRVGLRF